MVRKEKKRKKLRMRSHCLFSYRNAWDMALDLCLKQLPSVLKQTDIGIREPTYEPSSFFADQLTAFSVWLGENSLLTTTAERENLKQPEQLPIVLQVCYSLEEAFDYER
jgi:regulator-associated protein of mTOR